MLEDDSDPIFRSFIYAVSRHEEDLQPQIQARQYQQNKFLQCTLQQNV